MKNIIVKLAVAAAWAASARTMVAAPGADAVSDQKAFTWRSVERSHGGDKKDVAWLGVAVKETSEELQAQLGLKPGEGLVVTMVMSNSPAEKANLRKNDVLAEMDGQMLMDPLQLRKLVQIHGEGEAVKVTYYRAGKKESAAPKVVKTNWDNAVPDGGEGLFEYRKFNDLKDLNRSLSEQKVMIDQQVQRAMESKDVADQMKRAMEEARRSVERAVRDARAHNKNLGPADSDLAALAESGVDLDNDATMVVKKDYKTARSIVKTDSTGDYVLIADPKRRLTAHDHEGKLLFDGAIETPEQQAAVPKEVWEKVKPMLDQIHLSKDEKTELKADVAKPQP
ncbi:MAG TPA: PDZ domain-containing protein [Verrucomicrobiae bacterium]|jgi:hypothetical protein|nr:PDZ domain-containing protein [Verrucomicrobiae bacterium]